MKIIIMVKNNVAYEHYNSNRSTDRIDKPSTPPGFFCSESTATYSTLHTKLRVHRGVTFTPADKVVCSLQAVESYDQLHRLSI